MGALLKTIFYVPLYNGLLFLIGVLPGESVGLAVILFTLIIKGLLFPLSYGATKFQFEMKSHEAELNSLKEKHKNDKQAQGKAVLEFYRQKGINPFAGILPVFIQIPIVIALYYVFLRGGLPHVDAPLLYSFVPVPTPNMTLMGLSIGGKSIILAVLAGLSQYIQSYFAAPPLKPKSATPSFQDDLAQGMQLQMKYFLPVLIGFAAHVSGAVALYFITSNLFTIMQELYLRRTVKRPKQV